MTELTICHEYNGALIPQRISDEFVDVTALCQSEGKPFSDRKPVDTESRPDKDQLFWFPSIIPILKEHSVSMNTV